MTRVPNHLYKCGNTFHVNRKSYVRVPNHLYKYGNTFH